MSRRLRFYLSAVGLIALALLATHLPPDLPHRGGHYLGWTVICLLSELLWLSTLSGEGTVSMASTANLATLALWGPEASMWIVSTSTLVAVLFVQRTVAGVAAAMSMLSLSWPAGILARRLGWSFVGAALTPFIYPVLLYAIVNSAIVTLRQGGIRWRDTFYDLDTLRAGNVR